MIIKYSGIAYVNSGFLSKHVLIDARQARKTYLEIKVAACITVIIIISKAKI